MALCYRYLLHKCPVRLFLFILVCQFLYLVMQYGINTNRQANIEKGSINTEKQSKSYRKYVAISTSLEFAKDFYMFYLPMTCESWRRIGFEPIIIMVLSDVDEKFTDLDGFKYKIEINNKQIVAKLSLLQLKVIEYLNRLQVKIYYLRSFKNYEAQIGMLARLFIGYISRDYIANDNDYIILGDTDLIPINLEYYEFKNDAQLITVWNAFCCGNFEYNNENFREYPMSHIGMKKHMWRDILKYDSQFDVFFIDDSLDVITFDRSSIVRVINDFYGKNRFVINTEIGKYFV